MLAFVPNRNKPEFQNLKILCETELLFSAQLHEFFHMWLNQSLDPIMQKQIACATTALCPTKYFVFIFSLDWT